VISLTQIDLGPQSEVGYLPAKVRERAQCIEIASEAEPTGVRIQAVVCLKNNEALVLRTTSISGGWQRR
jgi:hypothetical protein